MEKKNASLSFRPVKFLRQLLHNVVGRIKIINCHRKMSEAKEDLYIGYIHHIANFDKKISSPAGFEPAHAERI